MAKLNIDKSDINDKTQPTHPLHSQRQLQRDVALESGRTGSSIDSRHPPHILSSADQGNGRHEKMSSFVNLDKRAETYNFLSSVNEFIKTYIDQCLVLSH